MKSERLKTICSLLTKDDSIIDIGCDHAYVAIEMARSGAKKVLASDIHPNALAIAQENIKQAGLESKIQTILSDGLKKIDTTSYNTIVIAGMGYSTIKHILSSKEKLQPIQKIILQSNNDLPLLRTLMMQEKYFLKKEIILYEKGHYYSVMLYEKKEQQLTEVEIEFGLYSKEHNDYYQDTKKHYQSLLTKVPEEKQKEIKYKLELLNSYLN